MLVTELYKGQGLGNQLACYITTRVLAKDLGYEFGIQSPELFKGGGFLDLDFGRKVSGGQGPQAGIPKKLPKLPDGIRYYYSEKRALHPDNGTEIGLYDDALRTIADDTKIDGNLQGEDYILHRKEEIREWLKVKEEHECFEYADENTCVINFRGGEYVRHPELYLKKEYWANAVAHMLKINQNFRFIVVTDDPFAARKFFPDFGIFHFSIAKDYSILKNAKYLILSNSSFAWFPAWLNEDLRFCIAPKYWARHNVSDGYWAMGCNLTRGWMYQDREGNLSDYDACKTELDAYVEAHPDYFTIPRIRKNFLVVSDYHNDISWVPEYADDYLVYDQSASMIHPPKLDESKVVRAEHLGHNVRDYCTFIIDHYDDLPDVSIFVTGNIFPRHISQPWFNRIVNNDFFTPIQEPGRHRARRSVTFISDDGLYNEFNNSWYLRHHATKYFKNYDDFLRFCFVDPVIPKYNRYAPGSNYIVPKENIRRLPKVFYENLRLFVSHCPTDIPGESYILEQAFYTLWHDEHVVSENMLRPLGPDFQGVPRRPDSPSRIFAEKVWLKLDVVFHAVVDKIAKGQSLNLGLLAEEKTPPRIKQAVKRSLLSAEKAVTWLRAPIDSLREEKRNKSWLEKIKKKASFE